VEESARPIPDQNPDISDIDSDLSRLGYSLPSLRPPEEGPQTQEDPRAAKAKILIVEDENIVALDLESSLESLGYTVAGSVSSGERAVEEAGQTRPDLVLMDITLKGTMDGMQAAAKIRERFDIPVIYLTAHADEATLQRAKLTQPLGYLLKPFEDRDLHSSIEIALYKHKMDRRLRQSERWLAITLKSIGDALIATDTEGNIGFANPSAEGLTGWSQAEMLGRDLGSVFRIIDDQTRLPLENLFVRVLREGVVVGTSNYTLLIAKDGTETPISYNAAPIRDDSGNITGAVLVFKDVSERLQAQKAIQSRNRELALLNQIIAASATSLEPGPVLDTVCRELVDALEVPYVAAALLNEEKTSARIIAEHQLGDRPSGLNKTLFVPGGPAFQHLLDSKTPFLDDSDAGHLVVPLVVENELAGSLSLEGGPTRHFSADEVDQVSRVANQVARALVRVRLNAERQRLGAAIEQTAEGVIITDATGIIIYVNPAFEEMTGYTRAQALGQKSTLLNSEEQDPAVYQDMWTTMGAGEVWHGRLIRKRADGSLFTVDTTVTPVRDERGDIVNYVSLQRDVTQELQREEQYRQAQKMQAIGQLTAGIAHDFNNMLTAINGFAELLQMQLSTNDPLYEIAGKILEPGWRAARIVSQLLAFSRKQVIRPQTVGLNDLITKTGKMLQPLIGENIRFETNFASDLWTVRTDPAQFEQVILNLAVNARDAMPDGGTFTIETANIVLEPGDIAQNLETQPGEYVLITISDTGVGMSDEVKSHIFEPFFTTKEVGEGSGLGLATVHGIVKQNGGDIRVDSEEGQGTVFEVYWPRARGTSPRPDRPHDKTSMPTGGETILLVEDDEYLCDLVTALLKGQGYTLMQAKDAEEALTLAASYTDPIHMLLTDVVMPDMNGKDLSNQLGQVRPDMKVLFMSGYGEDVIARHGILDEGIAFLEKPFSPMALACKVREVLDN
jgi:two-component system cell cycle sensor histidine kinase/response regulator CckA